MKRTKWSEEETLLLNKLYVNDGMSCEQIYNFNKDRFKNRTKTSICVKIKKMKLRHTKEQIFYIKSNNMMKDKNPMFGKESNNKGLNKNNSERIRNSSIKLSSTRKKMFKNGELVSMKGEKNPMFGKKSWNNDMTKYTDERLFNYGKKISEKKKNEWSLKSDDQKKIIIDRLQKQMIQNRKPTKIEIKIYNYLKSLNLNFVTNKSLNGFFIDFYLINLNIAIECDGDYWHTNPKFYKDKIPDIIQLKNIDRDKRKNKMLIDNEIKFLRLWEYDINYNFEKVKNDILILLHL